MNGTAKPGDYDPAHLLTLAALLFVGGLIIFVAGIIGVQIWKSGQANTESWAALTGLIGWATSQVSVIFSNRYGTTQQSQDKDTTIAQQARTAAVAQNALLDPEVVLSSPAGKKLDSALLPDAALSGAVTPAPTNPATGNVPAMETAAPTGETK